MPEVNAGILYHWVPDFYNSLYVGGSCYHITGQEPFTLQTNRGNRLSADTPFMQAEKKSLKTRTTPMWIDPKVLFMLQGQQKEITARVCN